MDNIISYKAVPIGDNPPEEINVIIENSVSGDPVKYEMDKKTGRMFVDRFLSVAMRYPGNYGFIPHTLSQDGDPVDVLVITKNPVMPGAVIAARPVGVLLMEDENGIDEKIIAVPVQRMYSDFDHIKNYTDLPKLHRREITHFFEHYKDLEDKKWTKIEGWGDIEQAKKLIIEGIKRQEDNSAN